MTCRLASDPVAAMNKDFSLNSTQSKPMKPKTLVLTFFAMMALFLGLSAADEKDAGVTNNDLAVLAAGTREAVVSVDDGTWGGIGAFISEDGLALVHLQGLMGKNRPEVLVSGGKNPKFGNCLLYTSDAADE